MPGEDGTGPMGTGQLGYRLGPCYKGKRNFNSKSYGWGWHGRHYGQSRRAGNPRFRRQYVQKAEIEIDSETEKKWIAQEMEFIEKHKTELNKRLSELNTKE